MFLLDFKGAVMSEAPCLRVPKAFGEKAITLARNLHLFDRELRVQQMGDHLHIPLNSFPPPELIRKLEERLPEFEISTNSFPERAKRPLKLLNVLEDKLPPHLLASLPHAIDFVGDIAVLKVPPELEGYKGAIGEAILKTYKRVHTVLAKSSAVEGVYRLRKFEVIAGVGKTETVHREHGCVYHVDLARTYFSPRLSYEHHRVASQVRDGETVVDMFSGIGPFSVLIAKRCKDVRVYAIDINPNAVQFLKKNIAANHVQEEVTPILGDVSRVVNERLTGIADRVIMNLPERALEYVNVASKSLRLKGGVVHYYEFTSDPDPLEAAMLRLTQAVEQGNRRLRILLARKVRATAPFIWQVVVDAEIH